MKRVSYLYFHPDCTIYRAPWRRFGYEEDLTQNTRNVCLSASENMSLNRNLKRSMKNASIKIYTLSRTTPKKRCLFHHRGLECKHRKSRDTWSKRQIWPWSTKWSRTKTNRVLPRKHTGHSKHPLPTTREPTLHMDITRRLIQKSDWLYPSQLKMEEIYIVTQWKSGADCG